MLINSKTILAQSTSPSLSKLILSYSKNKGYSFEKLSKKSIEEMKALGIIKEISSPSEILEGREIKILPESYAFPYPLNNILYHDPDITSEDLERKVAQTLANKSIENIQAEDDEIPLSYQVASLASEDSLKEIARMLMPSLGFKQKSKIDYKESIRNPFTTLKLYSKGVIEKINESSSEPLHERELPESLTSWFSLKEELSPSRLYRSALEYAKDQRKKGKLFLGFKVKGHKGNYFRTYLTQSEQGLAIASHPYLSEMIELLSKGIKVYNNTITGKVPSKEYYYKLKSKNLDDLVYNVSLDSLPVLKSYCNLKPDELADLNELNKNISYSFWRNFNGESTSPIYLYDKSIQSRSKNPKRSLCKIVDSSQIALYHTIARKLNEKAKERCKRHPLFSNDVINDTVFPIPSSTLTQISNVLRYRTFIISPSITTSKDGSFVYSKKLRKLNELELEYILMNYFLIQFPDLAYFSYSEMEEKEAKKGRTLDNYIIGKF